jgi:hypothetical protein
MNCKVITNTIKNKTAKSKSKLKQIISSFMQAATELLIKLKPRTKKKGFLSNIDIH